MKSCPICSNSNTYFINRNSHYIPQSNSITKIATDVMYCVTCDFFFNTFRCKKFFLNFYKKNTTRDPKIYQQYDLNKLIKVIKHTPYKHKDILEIGGGENIQTKKYFEQFKTKVFNYEKNTKYKSDRLKKKFDTIISFHVLEHVLDLHSHIMFLNQKLKNQGYFIVEVPDVKFYKKNIFLYNFSHLNHFSKKNLIKLMKNYDFKFIKKINATRKFGLLLIFKKIDSNINVKKLQNKIGINHIRESENKILSIVNKASKNNKLIIWGISEFITPILKKINLIKKKSHIKFIDINSQKKNSLKKFGIEVNTPKEITKNTFHEILILSPRKKVINQVKKKLSYYDIDYSKVKISNIGTNKNW
jgi:hypothetical protein